MKIIAEGPDGSGKSTLLQELSERFNMQVFHPGGPSGTVENYYHKIKETEQYLSTHLVDRATHISEAVYSNLRGGMPISDSEFEEVLQGLKNLNPIIIYCRLQTPDEMISLMKTSGKSHKTPEHFESIRNGYLKVIQKYDEIISDLESRGFTIILYNWKTDSLEDLINYILQQSRLDTIGSN